MTIMLVQYDELSYSHNCVFSSCFLLGRRDWHYAFAVYYVCIIPLQVAGAL